VPAGSGPPKPGDLIVWDEHIGVVESVTPDGKIQTIEGNSSDQVSRRRTVRTAAAPSATCAWAERPDRSGPARSLPGVNGLTAARGLRRSVEDAGGAMRISVTAWATRSGAGA
jgi:hypothetical protein